MWFVKAILNALFGGIAQWLNHLRDVAEAEKVGALKQSQATETQAQEKVQDAKTARDNVSDLTADEVRNSIPHNGIDPDFRD